jgi:F-type H+-transporting ATPase subunit gamma
MRLVAMSTITRLKSQMEYLHDYAKTIEQLYATVATLADHQAQLHPASAHELIIVVGSQKGLCGNFNGTIATSFEQLLATHHNAHIMTVGKKITELISPLLKKSNLHIASFDGLTNATIPLIVENIITYLFTQRFYTHVWVVSGYARNMFVQRARVSTLLPVKIPPTLKLNVDSYIWEQNPQELVDSLFKQYISAHLHTLLIASLFAEQSARFTSMDSATRNAKDVKEQMQLTYNKARQAKITKELTELTSSISGGF